MNHNHRSSIVAAIQFAPELLEVHKNLGTAVQLTHEAAAKGAGVIVLPEMGISGYALRTPVEAMECAQTRDGYQTQAFRSIAECYNCHIVLGYVELCEGNLYNSAVVIGPRGVEANHQKHNLWGNDYLWACPSEAINPVTVSRAGRLGVLICRDSNNNYRNSYKFYNENSRFYKKGSVDTIALLTNWSGEYGYPDSCWVDLAEETKANVVVSNRVGDERDLRFKGGSCVIDRNRKIWSNGSSFTEAAVVGGVVLL